MPPERRIVMEKSKDVKRRHQRSKPFRFTSAQIARIEREEQRENRAKQIREKEARRTANKKKKAEAETKTRTERRARGIPDPNIRVPSSQPLLPTFFNAQRPRSPQPVGASAFVEDIDLPDEATIIADRTVLGGTTDWDCFDLWTDGIDGCGPPKPQSDHRKGYRKDEIVVVDSSDSDCGSGQVRGNHTGDRAAEVDISGGNLRGDLGLYDDHDDARGKARPGIGVENGEETLQEVAVEDGEEVSWCSVPPVRDLDVPASHLASSQELGWKLDAYSAVLGASQLSHSRPSRVCTTQDLPRSSQCPQLRVASARSISHRPQLDSSLQEESSLASSQGSSSHFASSQFDPIDFLMVEEDSSPASSQGSSSHFASSQFDPIDFLIAEATVPIQPATRPDSTDIARSVDNGVCRGRSGDDGVHYGRLSLASDDIFDDETAGWIEDIFIDTHGHPFSDDRVDEIEEVKGNTRRLC